MAGGVRARVPAGVIVRLPNWLGDTVMAVPALRALREALSGVEILFAGPWAQLLTGQGLADVLVAYPRAWRGRSCTWVFRTGSSITAILACCSPKSGWTRRDCSPR